ncbi:MAG: TonB-dependent receptor [Ignavibacteriae bacterium]|nr:TonB-dependent receptor [Ignavibacteriota bacterium]
MKKILLVFFALLINYGLFAQDENGKKDTIEYKYPYEILITAPRLSMPVKMSPYSTSIVDKLMLELMPRTIAIDEPLKLVPGVKVDNQANGERVHLSIRGQGILSERGIRGINIILDGIPLNDPTGFAPDVFDVDWLTVNRMEVLRGPSASLYGGSASGGIINILTNGGYNIPLGGEAFGSYGSNNFWKAFGQYGGTVDKVDYRMSFSREMGDGYRVHTHFWSDKISGKAEYKPAKNLIITPLFFWTDTYHENPEGINLDQYNTDPKQANPDAVPFNEYLETNRLTGGVTGSYTFAENHDLQFTAYTKRTLFTEANNKIFNNRTIVTPGTSLQYTYNYGKKKDFIKNHFSVGSDLRWQTIDESRVDNLHSVRGDTLRSDETIKQSSIGLFAINKIDIGPKFNAVLSIRYDKINNDLDDKLKAGGINYSGSANFDKLTGRIGINYSLLPNLNVFASWGQGFLPPATEELAQNPDGYGGFNKNLSPATSSGEEIGLRGIIKDVFYYELTGFYMNTKNDFDRYRIPTRGQETFYRNYGASNRMGIELYGKWIPVKPVTVQLAYTFSSFKYADISPTRVVMDDTTIVKYIQDGNYLPNSPMHQLFIDVQYMPIQGLSFGVSNETVSKIYIDGANIESEAAPAYSLFNARVAYDWNMKGFGGEISFNLKNIGDTKYVAFTEPDPGGNAYQPGVGREIFGALKIRF